MDNKKRIIPGSKSDWDLELPDDDLNSLVSKNGKQWDNGFNFDERDDAGDELEEQTEKIEFIEGIKKLSSISSITVYERLNASNDKDAKEEFLANDFLIHPRNKYDKLKQDEIHGGIININKIMDNIETADWKQQKLAALVADDGIKKYNFLAANLAYNNARTEEERFALALEHKKANEALYGKPDRGVFEAILKEKLEKIEVEELSLRDRLRYYKLLRDIGPLDDSNFEVYRPKQETVERFSGMVKDFFGGFLRHVPENKDFFEPDEMKDIFNEVLENEFGTNKPPYKAVVSDEVSNCDANHELRQIRIPKNVKKPYSRERVEALLVHELGTHVMRAIPYLDSSIEIFATGLPNNETFDEGIAECIEQAIRGKYKDSGLEHYINIGLANFKGKNFREVYDIETTLESLLGKSTIAAINRVQRCFRGTGELPNNKDLAYYNGSTKVWQYIEEHIDDANLMENLFLSGKANIMDSEQERLVYEMRTGGLGG